MPAYVALFALALAAPADPVKEWQVRYDQLIGSMKKRDPKPFLKLLHRDYAEMADGLVVSLADVKKGLPTRLDVVARYGLKPKVLSAKEVGNTARVSFTMAYKATKVEANRNAVYLSTSRLNDTWVKVGKGWQLYRSAIQETITTRNGKVLKRPAKV